MNERPGDSGGRLEAGDPTEIHGSAAVNPCGDSGDNFDNNAGLNLAVLVLAGGRATRVGGGDKPLIPVAGRPMLDQILEDLARLDRSQHCGESAPGAETAEPRQPAEPCLVPHLRECHLQRVVVVGPSHLPVPPGVELTLEDPPFGGPVAGIIAGLRFLAGLPEAGSLGASPETSTDSEESDIPENLIPANEIPGTNRIPPATPDLVAILAGDSPAGARLIPALVSRLSGADASFDGCVARHSSGYRQYLCGVYRFEALATRACQVGAGTEADAGRNLSVRRFFQPLRLAEIPDRSNFSRDFDTWEDINSAGVGSV